MGVSSSPLAFAEKCLAASKAMEDAAKITVDGVALATKKAILDISPARLRNVGRAKGGAKLGVRYNVDNYPGGRQAVVFATGPWQIIEGNTAAHTIPKQRSRGKPRVAVIPGIGPRSVVHHPGTKGKHLFAKGAVVGIGLAGRITKTETEAALKTIF